MFGFPSNDGLNAQKELLNGFFLLFKREYEYMFLLTGKFQCSNFPEIKREAEREKALNSSSTAAATAISRPTVFNCKINSSR